MSASRWTSRKLFVALFTFLVSTGLLIGGLIDMANWQWATSITVGAYMASQGLADALNR